MAGNYNFVMEINCNNNDMKCFRLMGEKGRRNRMKMTAFDLFAAGARIIGILTIIKGIQVIIMSVPSLFMMFGQNSPEWAAVQQLITIVYPLALILIGFYLLAGIPERIKKLYPEGDVPAMESSRTVFKLAMKITGMVLVVYALPELLSIFSNALYIGYYQGMGINTSDQQIVVAERTLATLVSLLLGFYLLYGGRFFERLAFKGSDDEYTTI